MKLLQAAHEVNLRLHAPVPFHRRETEAEAPSTSTQIAKLAS
jgi:hypothetical protein